MFPTDAVEFTTLAPNLSSVLSEGGSSRLHGLRNDSHLLLKLYRSSMHRPIDSKILDRLIAVPAALGEPDGGLLKRYTSSPISRVVKNDESVSVLIPEAPQKYWASIATTDGRRISRPLTVDWLTQSAARLESRGIANPSWRGRLHICRSLAKVGEILEKEGIVYGDWSYSNALWSTQNNSGYLLDIDSCSFGPQRLATTPNWEDPLAGRTADQYVDRYRLSLLVGRCLTGVGGGALIGAIDELQRTYDCGGLAEVIGMTLQAAEKTLRPPVSQLLQAIDEALEVRDI